MAENHPADQKAGALVSLRYPMLMISAQFFAEDICTLKDDPSKIGLVGRTWHDGELNTFSSTDYNINRDNGVDRALLKKFISTGIPPRDHVFVTFMDPSYGSSLFHESKLRLQDRTLLFGDVVKRKSGDAMSGTVIRSSMKCTLQPSLPIFYRTVASNSITSDDVTNQSILLSNNTQSTLKGRSLELYNIPAEELIVQPEWQAGQFIIYRGWLGRVIDVLENVTIALSNGSVVTIDQTDELYHHLKPPLFSRGRPIDFPVPGMLVQTKKGNLRSGKWKYGAYDPLISPHGMILNTKVLEISVMWNYQHHSTAQSCMPKPPINLDLEALESGEAVVYDEENLPEEAYIHEDHPGSVSGSNISIGDCVRFKDHNLAAIKYNGSVSSNTGLSHGKLFTIPATASQGYDVNFFNVVQTRSIATVLWQDLTKSQEWAGSLIPYLNVDDHDVWPGEVVTPSKSAEVLDATLQGINSTPSTVNDISFENNQTLSRGRLIAAVGKDVHRPRKIGVVQLVDSVERIAQVRWSTNPTLELAGDTLLPGGSLGELAAVPETMSLYEITAKPELSLRIGDFVLVFPDEGTTADGNKLPRRQSSNGADQVTIDWFGQVVELGLDGLITVRLGAAAKAYDVRVPLHQTCLIAGGDDESDDESDDGSSFNEIEDGRLEGSLSSSENVLEETFEFEGGARLDTDDEEALWTTDDGDTDVHSDVPMTDADSNYSSHEESTRPSTPHFVEVLTIEPNHHQRPSETSVAKEAYYGADKFVMLESKPPRNHPFIKSTGDLSSKQLRRIQNEHKILQSSMPEDIYVRTWESRLDLLRVLIIGPHNTPYELAPFLMDFQFGQTFPAEPPLAFFHSWTGGVGRANPNLYEDGKICLSLLGTWPATEKNARWSEKSSMLQVLVSLMGLVLVREPYYNEAGFDVLIGSSESRLNAALYTERAYIIARGFVKHALQNTIDGFDDVLHWLYRSDTDEAPHLLREVVEEARETIIRSENKGSNAETSNRGNMIGEEDAPRKISAGALRLLKTSIEALEKMLSSA